MFYTKFNILSEFLFFETLQKMIKIRTFAFDAIRALCREQCSQPLVRVLVPELDGPFLTGLEEF